jgi:hypothetical protein
VGSFIEMRREPALEPIRIDRFRSTHQYGRVTLTAELSARPTPAWRLACEPNFARYFKGFGELPALVGDTIVVATTTAGLVTSQMALDAVVDATNGRCLDALVEAT